MKLFSVHISVAGVPVGQTVRVQRWIVVPVRAESLAEAARHPFLDPMIDRAMEGLSAPIVVQRQAYVEVGVY